MHKLNREYSVYHKEKYDRVGPLWQSRYKNRPINSQAQLLICGAYIELNAVRAGIVSDPAEYPWGSYRHYVGIEHDSLVDFSPEYIDLSPDIEERKKLYRLCMELWDARNYQPVISTPQNKQVEK
jgi:putative transposase